MSGKQGRRARWYVPSDAEYRRLVRLAERRLVGQQRDAEDVVSRALIKMAHLPKRQRARARIEQIIKTEAYSVLRSEGRAIERDRRAATDRGLSGDGEARIDPAQELVLFRRTLGEAVLRSGEPITDFDTTVIELALAGLNQAEIERSLGCTRSEVRSSVRRWARILGGGPE